MLHAAFPLSDLHAAERYFVSRGSNFLGKIVIVPDSQWDEHGAPFALASSPSSQSSANQEPRP